MNFGNAVTKKDEDERSSKNCRQAVPLPEDNFWERDVDTFKTFLTWSPSFLM